MMPSILHIGSVNDYAHYIGAEVERWTLEGVSAPREFAGLT